jgi:hypothetical protein
MEKERLPFLKQKLNFINVNYLPTNVDAIEENAVNGFALTEIGGTSHYPMLEASELLNQSLKHTIENILSQR